MKKIFLILVLILVFLPIPVGAAIATVSSGQATGTGSPTFVGITVGVTANPIIAVITGWDFSTGTETVSSVACSGSGVTCGTPVEVKVQRNSRTYISIWCIPNPVGVVTVTVTPSTSRPYQAGWILFSSGNAAVACPTGAGNVDAVTGTTNPLSVTLANLTANDAAVGIGANANAGDAPSFQQTKILDNNTTNVNASGGYHLGTGAVSCLWNGGGAGDAVDTFVAIRIAEDGGGGGGGGAAPRNLLTLGVGD